jgi:hypothetical protein
VVVAAVVPLPLVGRGRSHRRGRRRFLCLPTVAIAIPFTSLSDDDDDDGGDDGDDDDGVLYQMMMVMVIVMRMMAV